jgi:polyribonucleotide nucleotidyltransferase
MGKAGATLRSLEQFTGAQVSVAAQARDPTAPKDLQVRVATVQGTAEAVSAARDAILAAVADAADVGGMWYRVDEDVAAVHEERKAKPAKITTLPIWEAQVSWVVGKHGKQVADFEQRSGAVISVPKQGWVRKVVLRGDEEARTAARKLIEDSLPHTVTLDVPGAKIGALLGYKGETIKSIEAWSKATVSVPREGAMRTVVICGPTTQSVALAQAGVESALSAKAGEARRGRR